MSDPKVKEVRVGMTVTLSGGFQGVKIESHRTVEVAGPGSALQEKHARRVAWTLVEKDLRGKMPEAQELLDVLKKARKD